MRTPREIVDRLDDINRECRLFDHETPELIHGLPYRYAKPLIQADLTERYWESHLWLSTDKGIIHQIKLYKGTFIRHIRNKVPPPQMLMDYQRFSAWTWLLGNDRLFQACNHRGVSSEALLGLLDVELGT